MLTEVTVSELLLPHLAFDAIAQVRIDALGKRSFRGRIIRIHPNLDAVTRRGIVELELQPVPEGARPGQLCRVYLDTHTAARLLIPFSSLRRDTQGEYVYKVDGGGRV